MIEGICITKSLALQQKIKYHIVNQLYFNKIKKICICYLAEWSWARSCWHLWPCPRWQGPDHQQGRVMSKASFRLKLPRKWDPDPPQLVSPQPHSSNLPPCPSAICSQLTLRAGEEVMEQLAVYKVHSDFPGKSPRVKNMGEKGGAGWRKKGDGRQQTYQKSSERKSREFPVTEG